MIQIAKFLFEGLLRIWNSDYDIWSKKDSMRWWEKLFGEIGSFLARSILELSKPNRLRRKRKKSTGKTIVHSKTVVLITRIAVATESLHSQHFSNARHWVADTIQHCQYWFPKLISFSLRAWALIECEKQRFQTRAAQSGVKNNTTRPPRNPVLMS